MRPERLASPMPMFNSNTKSQYYKFDKILGHRVTPKDVVEYYIKWSGYGASENSWIGKEQFQNPADSLEEYLKSKDIHEYEGDHNSMPPPAKRPRKKSNPNGKRTDINVNVDIHDVPDTRLPDSDEPSQRTESPQKNVDRSVTRAHIEKPFIVHADVHHVPHTSLPDIDNKPSQRPKRSRQNRNSNGTRIGIGTDEIVNFGVPDTSLAEVYDTPIDLTLSTTDDDERDDLLGASDADLITENDIKEESLLELQIEILPQEE